MDRKTKGAWIVFQTGKLQRVEQQGSYENTFLSGKAGILLSAMSADSNATIHNQRLQAPAKASGINTKTELPVLLGVLEQQGLLDTGQNGIEILGVTPAATLQHTADIFDSLEPAGTEQAAFEIAE